MRERLRLVAAAACVLLTCGVLTACEDDVVEEGGGAGGSEQAELEVPERDPERFEFSLVPVEGEGGGDGDGAAGHDLTQNQAAPNEPAWQGCLLNWLLDWPREASDDYTLDATYGIALECDLPAMGGPTIDSDVQATLYDAASGEVIDEAPKVTGGWDTEDYVESSDTVGVTWPREMRMTAHVEMQLIPGCDIAGCGDPDPGWMWGPMPANCEGVGLWLAVCDYEWEFIPVGNAQCPTDPRFDEGPDHVQFHVTCSGGVSVTAEIANMSDDGKCTYAIAVVPGGEQRWDAVCEPGETKTVDLGSSTADGTGGTAHVTMLRQYGS
ncbi:hypothetical protein [Streptomyces sp. B6B3]|uniref:hypothetical protein n=1 Tax=Streptomyces sp. B6B3 TaxID=3153570 RepID=UPI00325E9F21